MKKVISAYAIAAMALSLAGPVNARTAAKKVRGSSSFKAHLNDEGYLDYDMTQTVFEPEVSENNTVLKKTIKESQEAPNGSDETSTSRTIQVEAFKIDRRSISRIALWSFTEKSDAEYGAGGFGNYYFTKFEA